MLLLTALVLIAGPAGARGSSTLSHPVQGQQTRTCGTLPGDGFYNYIVVTGVSCREGKKVATRAALKFCGRSCSIGVNEIKTGNVRVDGWSCSVKRGYEFSRERCRNGPSRLVQKSGA